MNPSPIDCYHEFTKNFTSKNKDLTHPLSISEKSDPFELFREWFDEAQNCEAIDEPTAMTLATVDNQGMPWARIVLLKEVSEQGFTFYTNLESIKADHLAANPRAGLCFYWMPLHKQVRIVGDVEKVSDDDADHYFASRPRESQLGAWASKQSSPMASVNDLMIRVGEYAQQFADQDIARPPFWSGYRVVPNVIEFWLRQPFRLHDRLEYKRGKQREWTAQTLYP